MSGASPKPHRSRRLAVYPVSPRDPRSLRANILNRLKIWKKWYLLIDDDRSPKLALAATAGCMKCNPKMAGFLRWLPMSASVVLMIMISVLATVSFIQLQNSNFWRTHSYEVLSTAEEFLSDLYGIQGNARDYAFTGQAATLAASQESVNTQQLTRLKLLTRDSPQQQERLRKIGPDLDGLIAYSQQLVEARDTQGLQAAIEFETNGSGRISMTRTVSDLREFMNAEHRLLTQRSTKAELDLRNTQLLLLSGSILATLLLVLANGMTGRAMATQKRLTHAAQAAELAKSEFLAIMSHEIRTPMNGVIGMTSILADTDLSEMQRECVSTISSSGESLMIVINDVLDFSKIESGRMTLERRSFNIRECVEEALDLFGAQIRIKGLEAVYLVARDVPSNLMGDPMRLRQILVNLIGNAIKFTDQGEIAINVEWKGETGKVHDLLFSVTDTGIGISKESAAKLFQAFQQVDTSTTRRYGGTGLGLVISQRLAEFMGGTIWVESEPELGSSFFFSVKMEAAESAVPDHQSPDSSVLSSHRVLVVDDNANNRRILDIQLKMWGMIPTCASCAADALRKLEEQEFDIILTDFQMPEMDGLTFAKEAHRRKPTSLILLLSSGEIIAGEDAKLFHTQLSKPVKHSSMFNALLKIFGTKPEQPAKIEKSSRGSMAAKDPLRILLAEDNIVNQQVGLLMISQLGYSADLAPDGQLAVNAAEKVRYDLILMDIQMPNMNGIDAARKIRDNLGDSCPLIFALTAEALEGDKQRFLGLGFDGYLSKPLQSRTLEETLKKVKATARLVKA
jgi:signal transduction histidine kinase/DNA-binding response OmpR family regulator